MSRWRNLCKLFSTSLHGVSENTLIDLKSLAHKPEHFTISEDFLTLPEQKLLLFAALCKLDGLESARSRRKRKRNQPSYGSIALPMDLFHSEDLYEFEKGHYDGVIRNFRETYATSWPSIDRSADVQLATILGRIRDLLPSSTDVQTHILHLSSHGEILPHIDSVSASGSYIVGVSLGTTRIMRMESIEEPGITFDVLLPSGSVYVQRDLIRYRYRHSILPCGLFKGEWFNPGPRVSVVIRVRWLGLETVYEADGEINRTAFIWGLFDRTWGEMRTTKERKAKHAGIHMFF